jgi:hypothetical protein
MTGLRPQTAWAASTPNQGVCAPLKAPGVTDGLYGLCVSYCVALDCPDVSKGAKKLAAACEAPDRGLLTNYNKLRRPSDPTMPCVKSGCPCWTQSELSQIGRSYTPHLVDEFLNEFSGSYSSIALVENRVATDSFPYGAYQLAQTDKNADGTALCYYFKAEFQPGASDPIIRVQEISTADANICQAQIEDQVTALERDGIDVKCSGNLCPA